VGRAVAIAHEHERDALPLAARERARDRQQLLAHRAGRRDEQQQLAAPVGAAAADVQRSPSKVDDVELRRRLADLNRVLGAERAERRHPLVQDADLADQRHDRERQDHNHDPQRDLGDDQGLHRL
jgi:hypothetical protein